jgi:predicted metal-dependent hydrolase
VGSKTIECGKISICLEKSKRAKYVSISIKPYHGVRVAVPYRVSFKEAETIAKSKMGWIEKHLYKIQKAEENHQKLTENEKAIDRKTAKTQLIERLHQLSKQHGFTYNKVFIKNQKTRWGSCSEKNNINLNYNLVRLPDELIDYILLHELVHTRIKNHSSMFWDALDRIIGNAKELDKKLKNYSLLLL